ncbi:OLC1v1024096C1 [Oldenlandia corymbosa var. corymbosa]|uniref:OLC1v1024096C1 n=1 Tax=Oldenlandia corymbosa var. corymbosa TaxID=529605 RepID=A0AAV1C1H2_OLDCO|nr:OLC1v1024096C1 [Oldenlandia corymbosa var. corymbosa]
MRRRWCGWKLGLLRHVGICHGISGNAYVFHALYRLAGSPEFRFKAKSFACFLLDRGQKLLAEGEMRGGDHPFSLFEGIGGMADDLFPNLAFTWLRCNANRIFSCQKMRMMLNVVLGLALAYKPYLYFLFRLGWEVVLAI